MQAMNLRLLCSIQFQTILLLLVVLLHIKTLKILRVGRNNLSGSIPKELASLSKLEFLAISHNNLTAGIPPFIGNFSSLQLLAVAANKLSGLIPPSLYNLSSITDFHLCKNKLSGSLPTNLFLTLPHLQRFFIYETNLLDLFQSHYLMLQSYSVSKLTTTILREKFQSILEACTVWRNY